MYAWIGMSVESLLFMILPHVACLQTVPSVLPYCLIQWKRGQLTPANLLPLDRDFIGISALVAIGCEA